jgi:MYXO-CTERM domain-containing protein
MRSGSGGAGTGPTVGKGGAVGDGGALGTGGVPAGTGGASPVAGTSGGGAAGAGGSGTSVAGGSGGCGCRIGAPRSTAHFWTLALAALAMATVFRSRRCSARSSARKPAVNGCSF